MSVVPSPFGSCDPWLAQGRLVADEAPDGTPEVYSVRDIASAASVDRGDVVALLESGQVQTVGGHYLTEAEAVKAVRLLSGVFDAGVGERPLFGRPIRSIRPAAAPFAASTVLHAAIALTIALLALGWKGTITEARAPHERARLVFVAIPGEGGGGGGGGLRQPTPPARAELKGRSSLRSPVRTEPRRAPVEPRREPPRPPDPQPVEKPKDVPVVQPAAPVPPVTAPVAPVAADDRDQPGAIAPPAASPSQGPGSGGGSGTGQGTGMGEGKGSGIGGGEGGGTGGGPYRPGSGITPPGLLREVKPQYTEEARRLGIEGDVVLEVVVRADGTVGPVTILQRLGSGLDQRAIEAVRQWRFSPARRFGTPVDVLVEVAVEFKLR